MTTLCDIRKRRSCNPVLKQRRSESHQHARTAGEPASWKTTDASAEIDVAVLTLRVQALISHEISFIHDAAFKSRSMSTRLRHEMEALDAGEEQSSNVATQASSLANGSMHSVPLLEADEERRLFQCMNFAKFLANSHRSRLCPQNPNAAEIAEIERLLGLAACFRNRILCANTRLVASIARRFAKEANRFDELLSDGYLVLLKAIEKFDASRGFRFSTYATHAIRREFYHSLYRRKKDPLKTAGSLERETVVGFSSDVDAQDFHRDRFQRYQWIMRYIEDEFNARDQTILSLRFGVADESAPQTLMEVGAKLGLSKERIRQLQMHAVEQLREAARKEFPDELENRSEPE